LKDFDRVENRRKLNRHPVSETGNGEEKEYTLRKENLLSLEVEIEIFTIGEQGMQIGVPSLICSGFRTKFASREPKNCQAFPTLQHNGWKRPPERQKSNSM
jgi:hypothetical protein